jgi:Zn-finger nucleic acid-binding protein
MVCPECKQNLTTYDIATAGGKKVSVEKCPHCFSFWLDRWEEGLLSKKDIEKLTLKDKKKDLSVISSFAKKCPHCQIPLTRATQKKESSVAVFNCSQCLGSWFPAGQLLEYKKDKEGRNLTKTVAGLPLKSIPNFVFPVIILLLITISIPLGLSLLKTPKETRTQAGEKIQKIHVIPLSPTAVIISFKAPSVATSEVFYSANSDNLSSKASQTTPSFYQQIKLKNLYSNTTYYYQILLKEDLGKTTQSEILNFTTQDDSQKRNLLN